MIASRDVLGRCENGHTRATGAAIWDVLIASPITLPVSMSASGAVAQQRPGLPTFTSTLHFDH